MSNNFLPKQRSASAEVIAVSLALVIFSSSWFSTAFAQQAVEPQAVDFTLQDIEGNSVRLSSYLGRWVIINFWATWCTPCLQEIPELSWVNEKYNTKAVVIGVNYETINRLSLKNFIDEHSIDYPVVQIGAQPLIPFEPLIGLPSTFFVDPKGYYVARHTGVVTAHDIKNFIE